MTAVHDFKYYFWLFGYTAGLQYNLKILIILSYLNMLF